MSRTYDTGLEAPQRTLIQNKIIELLQALKRQSLGGTDAKGFVEAIIPLGFRVEKEELDTIDALYRAIGGKSPAIAVAPLGMRSNQAGGPAKGLGDLVVELYFVSTHMRDRTEGRVTGDAISAADDTADPGMYAMLELAWERLYDVPLGIKSVHELKLHDEDELITSEKGSVWFQRWRVMVGRDANLLRGLVQKFTNAVTELDPTDDQPPAQNIKVNTTVG